MERAYTEKINKGKAVDQYDLDQINILNPEEEQNLSQFAGDLTKIFEDAKKRADEALDVFYKHIMDITPQSQDTNSKKIQKKKLLLKLCLPTIPGTFSCLQGTINIHRMTT